MFQRLVRVSRDHRGLETSSFEDRPRIVIVHNHLFKNAGSTIDWALGRNFGAGFVDHRDDKSMKRGPEYLREYLRENTWIEAISSHHLALPLPKLDDMKFLTIMMFRHPIERVTSVYNFERGQVHATTLGAEFAREHTLKEYVLWRMRCDVPPTIRNFHVRRTPPFPAPGRTELTDKDLTAAMAYIKSVEMLGLVERFDESMVLFEETLRQFFPDIDLAYQIQNVGQNGDGSRQDRIEQLQEKIGLDAFKWLENRNALDLTLYNRAIEVFRERLGQLTSLEDRLADFKQRCRRVAQGIVSD